MSRKKLCKGGVRKEQNEDCKDAKWEKAGERRSDRSLNAASRLDGRFGMRDGESGQYTETGSLLEGVRVLVHGIRVRRRREKGVIRELGGGMGR
eukprot:6195391-Pleurochrysis_carterae.AAC.2